MRRLTTSKGYLEINLKKKTLEFRAWRDTETMKLEITSTCSAFKKYLNDFIYYLLTESEDMTGKSQTEALMY